MTHFTCPRCHSAELVDHYRGPDGYDHIAYACLKCNKCGLWYDGWLHLWLLEEDSEEVFISNANPKDAT